jgi:hypothetical protein
MKKWLILFLALPFALQTYSQQKFFEEAIGWRGSNIDLHTISDQNKHQHCLFLCNRDSIRAFLLDNSNNIIQRFYLQRDSGENFLGGFIKKGKIYAFLQDEAKSSHLHSWVLDIVLGSGQDNWIPFEMKHERVVEQINCGDHFLYLAVNRKASKFVVYDFLDGANYDTLQYQFEPRIWKALTTSNSGFGRDINVVRIDPESECSPGMAQVPNKLYWLHDSLCLLMNGYEEGVTAIFSFDLRNKQVNFRKIIHNNVQKFDPDEPMYIDNSMLLGEKLYFVSAEPEKINLQIRDFHDGRLLREYTAVKGEEISFKNTPITQEGGAYGKTGPRELGRTRQLIRKMLSGTALIIAEPEDSSRVSVVIGSYMKMTSSGPGLGMWGPVGHAASSLIVGASVGFSRGSWEKSARFKTLLDSATLEHLPGEIMPDITERIEEYTKGISIPAEGENLFRNSAGFVYAYYSRDEHKLMLVNF